MIGMQSNPQQDLQALQPAMRPQVPQMPQVPQAPVAPPQGPMGPSVRGVPPTAIHPPTPPAPGPVEQKPIPNPLHGANTQGGGFKQIQHYLGTPSESDPSKSKGTIVKNAVKGAAKGTVGVAARTAAHALAPGVSSAVQAASKAPAGMKWILDFLNKRHDTHMNHEKEILSQIISEAKARGGGAPASMAGHEQDYYDNTRNTGNQL